MDIMQVRNCIEKLISEVGKCRREIEAKGKEKAKAISNYDRKLAIALVTLRNSENFELAGKSYPMPPVSIMEKIAKGICFEEAYQREIAESAYKAVISNLEALKAQLNGFQSIFKHMD